MRGRPTLRGPVYEGRCNISPVIPKATKSEAREYATQAGFYSRSGQRLSLDLELQKMFPVMQQLVDGLMHVGQSRVALLLFE